MEIYQILKSDRFSLFRPVKLSSAFSSTIWSRTR